VNASNIYGANKFFFNTAFPIEASPQQSRQTDSSRIVYNNVYFKFLKLMVHHACSKKKARLKITTAAAAAGS
jgi:hypothetical protein